MKRITAVILLILLVSLAVMPASAAELGKTPSIVFMGDSITKGYGVDQTMAYAYLVAESFDTEYKNISQNGLTSTGLVNKFNQTGFCDTVKSADIVAFTIGGNDLIASFLKIASTYAGRQITSIEDGAVYLSSLTTAQLQEMMSNESAQAEVFNMLATYKTNLDKVLAKIKELNPGADILILTQYNPMSGVEALAELDGAAEQIFVNLNAVMIASAEAAGAKIVDIYATLKNGGGLYTFIEGGDIHPNPDGHELIADEVIEYLENNIFNQPEWTVPETTTAAPTDPVTDPTEITTEATTTEPAEKGCGGVSVIAILAAVISAAAVVVIKKK